MHILVTNDDGITAPGIQALWRELASIAEVTVVAPDTERSACSQSITVHQPIRVDQFLTADTHVKAWSVGGTPTDCVKVALESILSNTPDIVISGINHGANLGTDVLYSGTVSAAIEGALHGLPAIAVSLADRKGSAFDAAARFARTLIERVLSEEDLPANTLLNVNVPPVSDDKIQGIRITKLGHITYNNVFEKREDPRGRTYYWMAGSILDAGNDPDSDVEAVKEGYISITPVHFDLTNYPLIKKIRNWRW